MNIQIFGTTKSFDTKKAQRYFSERKIKAQFIDLREKPMSRGELDSVKAALGGCDALIDMDCRDKELLALVKYLGEEARYEKIFENQILLRTPVVRNGRKATAGYAPQVWETWE